MQTTLIIDRSSAQTLIAFGSETLTLDGRDDAWVEKLHQLLNGRRPTTCAVGLGPGSFAGIRAAIATLQGMGIALGLQPVGFPSAAILALASGLKKVTVIGDARRGTLWSVRYTVSEAGIKQETPFTVLNRATFTPTANMVSPDAARLKEFNLPLVEPRAELLQETFAALAESCTNDPLPIYLHPAVGATHAE